MATRQDTRWYTRAGGFWLDWQPARLVSVARFILAAYSLAAIFLDPTQPARSSDATYLVLLSYCLYAAVVMMAGERWWAPRLRMGLHAVDIVVFAVLMQLTDGPTSPFFVFFTYSLLAATIQWNWRGAVTTAGLLIVLLFGLAAAHTMAGEQGGDGLEINRLVMRSAYLFVAGVMLAYVGAFQEHQRQRLATLAAWPSQERSSEGDEPRLEGILGHAAGILQARRILVVWEETEEPDAFWTVWENGSCDHGRETADRFSPMVAPHFSDLAFASSDEQTAASIGLGPDSRLNPALVARFGIDRMATAPMSGSRFAGRVFVLDPWRRNQADLVVFTQLVAARIGVSLDHHAQRVEIERAAVSRERIRLARDMHDGVLQALTAVALQLKSIAAAVPTAPARRLEDLRAVVSEQQQRIRAFVRMQRADTAPSGDFRLDTAGELLIQAGRQWGLEAKLRVEPSDATVAGDLGYQICLIVTEAIANAARHGGSRLFDVELLRRPGAVVIRTLAKGAAIPGLTGTFDQDALDDMQSGPRSILERVRELSGTLQLTSDAEGVRLDLTLPAP